MQNSLLGNISRENLSHSSRQEYLSSLSRILKIVYPQLISGQLNALDAAVAAVKLFEDDPLFNAGKGAVFTLDGTNELEASVMVSRGQHKRCAGVFLLKHVKNPILLAKELLLRDDPSVERGRQHNCLSGPYAEKLAEGWGLDIVDPSYFFTEKRWEQHLKDLERDKGSNENTPKDANLIDLEDKQDEKKQTVKSSKDNVDYDSSGRSYKINLEEYLPKGTVGCVVLDDEGLIAAATSTGGLTNKVPGRIGDTPTPGAGFWAEQWDVESISIHSRAMSAADSLTRSITGCLSIPPSLSKPIKTHRAVGLSGTGNGDYFLRLSACHNITSRCRFGGKLLREAAREVCGPDGEMERAGEGRNNFDGAVIGVDEDGEVVMEMNCGGCFRGTVDDEGRILVAAYADEPLECWTS
ncbi:L-asparaginase [Dactylellina cionopaga]|nr:L-asparaginase [Dactylellina cionopaga]